MSSRHAYLYDEDLGKAVVIGDSLRLAESMIRDGNRSITAIESKMRKLISRAPGVDIDYISFNRWDDLTSLNTLSGRVIVSLVVKISGIRLLDNMIISVRRKSKRER